MKKMIAEKDEKLPLDSIAESKDKKNVATTLAFYEKVLIPPKFTNLKISGKIDLQTVTTYLPTLNSTLYIEQDQKIWINLNVLLINVARGQATPEGIEAYVKTDKSYVKSDFKYLNDLLNVNIINYKTLEKLLIGRTFIRPNTREFQMKETDMGYALVSIVPQQYGEGKKTDYYDVRMEYAPNYDLKKVELKNIQTKDQLIVAYENWIDFQEMRLPQNVKIIIKGSKSGEILIENTKFEAQKMNPPFTIPKNYSKIEIK